MMNTDRVMQQFDSGSPLIQFVAVVVVILGTVLLMATLNSFISKLIDNFTSTKNILSGTRTAKRRDTVSGKDIKRSSDKDGGLEFSYSFWFYVDDWTYKVGKWKHLFHKGGITHGPDSPENTVIKCPGAWLDRDQNILHLYFNTFEDTNENFEIPNIPLSKWVNCILTVQGRNVDTYLNGEFIKRSVLTSLPRQNYGDITITQSRGFSGYVSRFKYFNYSVSYSEIEDIVRFGPARTPCADTGEVPPY
jgi:hypothetical protein